MRFLLVVHTMSRCFPFPPPGYERKVRAEDLDLLKKEKHKKKRDKEKRDDKDKRKRKNKDKKDKCKDRVRDKASSLGERRLPKKINDHNGQSAEGIVQKDHKGKENCIATVDKYAGQSADHIGGKFNRSWHLPEETRDFKIVPTLGKKRIKDGDGRSKNPLGEKFSVHLSLGDDWVCRVGNAKDENKEGDEKKTGDQEIQNELKFSRGATIRGPVNDNSVEKNADNRMDGKRREGHEHEENNKEKQKDKDGKQEGRSKEKNRDKKEKRGEKIEQKIRNLEKSKESNKNNVTSSDSIITSEVLRDSHKPVAKVGKLMKRPAFETNKFLQAKDCMSSNLTKFTSSSDLPRGNGKILRPYRSSFVLAASNWQVTANSPKVDYKEHGLKDIVKILPALSSPKSVQADQIAAVQSKPSHPDFNYLSQVYLVPEMEERPDLCDHDWLYSNHASGSKKLKVHRLEMEMTPHVWAEAMQIESTDICALPYVIPY